MADLKQANLIRQEDTQKVYAETEQGLRHIQSPDVMEEMGRKFKEVSDISEGKMEARRKEVGMGEPITAESLAQETSAPDSMKDQGGTINASDIQDMGDETPPEPDTGKEDADSLASDAESEGSKAESTASDIQDRIDKYQESVAELSKQREETAQTMKDKMEQLKQTMFGGGREKKLEAEREEMGVTEKMQKVSKQANAVADLKGELSKIKEDERAEKERAENRLASQGAINDAKRKINRDYARKKARKSAEVQSEAAVLAAYQDNLARAQSAVNKTVQAWTFDRRQKVSYLNTVISQESSWYNTLSSEEQSYLNRIQSAEQEKYQREKWAMSQKMQLRLDAVQRGIDLGDMKDLSVAEATKRYEKNVVPEIRTAEEKRTAELRMKYPTADIKAGDDLQTALNKAQKVAAKDRKLDREAQQALTESRRGTTGEGAGEGEGEIDTGLSDYKLAQLAAQGVPNNVSNTIQSYLNQGYGWKKIMKGMENKWGGEKAIKYAEGYNKVMGESRQVINVGVPEIKKGGGLDFESMLSEKPEETTSSKTENNKAWYKPWTWEAPWQ